jgi:hypothetical protein
MITYEKKKRLTMTEHSKGKEQCHVSGLEEVLQVVLTFRLWEGFCHFNSFSLHAPVLISSKDFVT